MSDVEVLEDLIEGYEDDKGIIHYPDARTKKVLKKALLALEKLDRLEKWLDKQETKKEQEKQNYNKVYLGVRLNFLKEVREVLDV